MTMSTPWGPAQQQEQIALGIVEVSTAGHGGIHVSPALNGQVHTAWRRLNGWYEEDCDWAFVALTFPQHFPDKRVAYAHDNAKRWHPKEYALVMGVPVRKTMSVGKCPECGLRTEASGGLASVRCTNEDGARVPLHDEEWTYTTDGTITTSRPDPQEPTPAAPASEPGPHNEPGSREMTDQMAVKFDPDAFRVWLDEAAESPVDGGTTNREVGPYLRNGYQRRCGEAGWMVESVLDMLRSSSSQPHPSVGEPWVYGDGVSDLRVWAIADPEGGPDGALAGQVMVDGVPLAIDRMTEQHLVPDLYEILPGYEAAEHALTALAERINEVAAAARPIRRPAGLFGQLTDDDVVCALLTLAEYRRGNPDLSDRQDEVAEQVARLAEAMDDDDMDD